jgi:hypothetical protein
VILLAVSTGRTDEGCLSERGRIPFGTVGAIAEDFPRLLYGSGSALVVDDVSDPSFPRREGFLKLGGSILDLETQGRLTYATTEAGLFIIDTDSSGSPQQVGFVATPHPARAVRVHGWQAFVAGGTGLSMVHVGNPASPRIVKTGRIPRCDYQDLELDYPLLFATGCGFQIIDLAKPPFPNTVARLDLPVAAIDVEGSIVAVASWTRLQLIDVSDPSNPMVRGSIWTHGLAQDVALTGNIAVASSATGLTIADVASPDDPIELANFAFAGGATTISVAGDLVYAANRRFLRIVSLDDPSTPTEIARIGEPSFVNVAASGRLAIATHGGFGPREHAVTVLDLGRREPTVAGSWEALWRPIDVELIGSLGYVTGDGGLYVLDLGDPANPLELSFVDLIESQSIGVDSGHAYIATYHAGGFCSLTVVDVSDPTNPYRQGSLYFRQGCPISKGIDAEGNTAVIADSLGLLVIDVSDPWLPIEVGRWDQSGASDVTMVGGQAVLAFASPTDPQDTGIAVVDPYAESGPALVGTWRAPGAAYTVGGYGQAVVVGTKSDGIFLIDIEDPTLPKEICHWSDRGFGIVDLATAWPTIVATHGGLGLTVLELERPDSPPRRRPSRRGRLSP